MHFSWSTIALQLVNFAVLVWLLQRLLYRPVLRLIEARQADVARLRAEATQADRLARERLGQLDAERARLTAERDASLKAGAAEAGKLREAAHAEAEREAEALLEKTREGLAEERRQALEGIQQAALDLATDLAGRLLAGFPEPLRSQAWLERIGTRLAALTDAERAALLRDVGDHPVRIVTAEPLPAVAAADWGTRLARTLGAPVGTCFEVDPQLLGGAELYFGDTRLAFTLREALQALRMELAHHADAT